ncbi:MAG: 3-hydroxyacyl-CoA dehydrogenase family protein [Terriglobales bacterium]
MDIKNVAVIGAGIMGHGIAQVAATAGCNVHLNDIEDKFLQKAYSNISDSLAKFVSKGKMSAEERDQILSRISVTTDFCKAVKDADLVVEAVSENLELKKDIFKRLSTCAPAGAILATNTSQYSITEIASAVPAPSRVIGMHWFNPPVLMKLIEVVRGHETAEETVETIRAFAAKVGKETVVCKDSQGFISTRALMALRLECYRILEEGVATKEDIDKTLRLALGHPMGQFELADFSGLDLDVPASEGLTKIFGDRFRPPQTVLHLVKAGKLGRKTGRGWYDYTGDGK